MPESDMQHGDFHYTDYVWKNRRSEELPGRSPVCDLNLGKVCSLIIRELGKGEHWDKVRKKTCQESDCCHTQRFDLIKQI